MKAAKVLVGTLFLAASFCALFMRPGPLNSAAWVAVVPLDALVIGYYAHKEYARSRFLARFLPR